MKNIKEVLKETAGMDDEARAKAIASYYAEKHRKQTVEDARRETRSKLFKDCKKLTKSQQEAYIYEFFNENYTYFNVQWLRKKHSELFEAK